MKQLLSSTNSRFRTQTLKSPPSFLGIVVLIFWFKSIFLRNVNRFINLVIKAKQQNGIQLPYIFLKFYMNQFSNQFLLFLHFPGLWILVIYVESSFRVISLPDMKVGWIYFLLFNHYRLMIDYLYFPNNLKDIKDHI